MATTPIQLDDGDIGCLLRDHAVEGKNLNSWLLTWLMADNDARQAILHRLHLHGEEE